MCILFDILNDEKCKTHIKFCRESSTILLMNCSSAVICLVNTAQIYLKISIYVIYLHLFIHL